MALFTESMRTGTPDNNNNNKNPAVAEIADRTAFVYRVESCTGIQSDGDLVTGYSTVATPLIHIQLSTITM